jgi:hypothetical protein
MATLDVPNLRLQTQMVSDHRMKKPEDVVEFLVCVQAQDYFGALWALGLRIGNVTEPEMERAFIDGSILRTHILRPTWHFVSPKDIRWIQALTGPRVKQNNSSMGRKLGLDNKLLSKCQKIIAKALSGGNMLTRNELRTVLAKAGIEAADSLRMAYILMEAELDCLIVSGPRRGKQFTYMLLDERAPATKPKKREDALEEFSRRYFATHGPATVHDMSWYSGLTIAECKEGLEMVKDEFEHTEIGGKTFWFAETKPKKPKPNTCYLLPNYDEYGIGYRDRSEIFETEYEKKIVARDSTTFMHLIIIDSKLVGTWRRKLRKNEVIIESKRFRAFNATEETAFKKAADDYGRFLGLKVKLAKWGKS